ncbi:MAG: adenylate kinase [Candidatus Gastranaerophilales bacterium]|nr:adenylate kinase [Candidatus Gastranaerophilales bacterium]
MKREFIFIGPPGSGKGTQTKMLSKDFNLPHIDTGSLLREEVSSGSEEGKLADSFMEKGQLVPIELVSKIIKNRLLKQDCQNGFILDGYPRSLEQAYALDDILKEIDKNVFVQPYVFYFEVDQKQLIERLINRRSCSVCGAIYNLKTMSLKDETKCQKCGGNLIRREDDTEEVANKRFKTYFDQTAPLIDLYTKRGLLIKLNASFSIDEIYKNLTGAIKENVHS